MRLCKLIVKYNHLGRALNQRILFDAGQVVRFRRRKVRIFSDSRMKNEVK